MDRPSLAERRRPSPGLKPPRSKVTVTRRLPTRRRTCSRPLGGRYTRSIRFQPRRARCQGRTYNYVLADQEVRLRVTLAPQSSPHRTRAIAALCDELNRATTLFPGSRLRLRYSIRQPK